MKAPFTLYYYAAECQSMLDKDKWSFSFFHDLDRVIISDGATFLIPVFILCKVLSVGWVHQGIMV